MLHLQPFRSLRSPRDRRKSPQGPETRLASYALHIMVCIDVLSRIPYLAAGRLDSNYLGSSRQHSSSPTPLGPTGTETNNLTVPPVRRHSVSYQFRYLKALGETNSTRKPSANSEIGMRKITQLTTPTRRRWTRAVTNTR